MRPIWYLNAQVNPLYVRANSDRIRRYSVQLKPGQTIYDMQAVGASTVVITHRETGADFRVKSLTLADDELLFLTYMCDEHRTHTLCIHVLTRWRGHGGDVQVAELASLPGPVSVLPTGIDITKCVFAL